MTQSRSIAAGKAIPDPLLWLALSPKPINRALHF